MVDWPKPLEAELCPLKAEFDCLANAFPVWAELANVEKGFVWAELGNVEKGFVWADWLMLKKDLSGHYLNQKERSFEQRENLNYPLRKDNDAKHRRKQRFEGTQTQIETVIDHGAVLGKINKQRTKHIPSVLKISAEILFRRHGFRVYRGFSLKLNVYICWLLNLGSNSETEDKERTVARRRDANQRWRLEIYIGGLGSSVQEDDLKKTFTSPQLGSVQSVEIIRSKGRSFGYLEYAPASDKGLAKLFSTYNGCMWKGGRLKLEKAKEDYLSRLRREWTEDAELEMKSSNRIENDSAPARQNPKVDQDINKLQLNIFFPKLRKHCGPLQLAKRNTTDHHETRNIGDKHEMDAYGVNEDELNMMKSILGKLLEDEDNSKSVFNEAKPSKEINKNTDLADDNLPADKVDEEELESDEDSIVINIVGRPSKKRVASFEDWGQRTTPTNQDSLSREFETSSKVTSTKLGSSNKEKPLPDKKRKQPVHDITPSKKKSKKESPLGSTDNPISVNTQPTETKSASTQLSSDAPHPRKSAWRDLTSNKENTAFCISDILSNPNPEPEPRSDPLPQAPPHSNEDLGHEDQSNEDDRDMSELTNAQLAKPSGKSEDKYARGPFWRQKSSWLQLIADTNKSAFNISQILPGANFEKPEVIKSGNNDFSNLRIGIEDSEKSHVGANEGSQSHVNQTVDVLIEKKDFELKSIVEEKDEASVPEHVSSNLLQSSRVVPEIVISETCPFMRSDASMKEWAKTKAAVSGSLKKDGKGKKRARG
ncbi:RNA-binding (RRM/RBD/RNP motifs) family protein [Striga asiatica]|uniref:RNA-binding (RRM/RBD/RNP motifs) family protein n=1 Tax=Striga asiatica TaxID=4170 RepID=A0A5A7PTH7_STRAF|nr:RNA-binding (RRM/RBD/RNP motifs) family protein [Striga asiatica]